MDKVETPPQDEPKPAQNGPETAPERQPPGTSLGKFVNMAAYPAGAASGFMAFETEVRSKFYGNFAKRKLFTDLQKPTTQQIKQVIERAATDKNVNVSEETWKIQESYRIAVKDRIEQWGYKGLRDYWKCLHQNQQIKILSEAATVSGITLGALILLSENIDRVRDVLRRQPNEQGPSR